MFHVHKICFALYLGLFYPTDDGTHAPAIQPANNIHMPKKQPRDFGIFLLWILKWNFLQTHERLKRARRTPHYSTSAHSSSQIHPNKIWITVFGWHAALAIVINVSSVEAESRLMNDLLASVCAPIKSNWMWYYKATNRYLVKREFEKKNCFFFKS